LPVTTDASQKMLSEIFNLLDLSYWCDYLC